jgi:hypothetical protein
MQSVLLQKSYSLKEFARQNAIGLSWRDQSRPSIGSQSWPANNHRGRGRQGLPEQLPKVQPRVRVASIVESPIVNGNSKAVQSAVAAAEPASEAEVVTQHD